MVAFNDKGGHGERWFLRIRLLGSRFLDELPEADFKCEARGKDAIAVLRSLLG